MSVAASARARHHSELEIAQLPLRSDPAAAPMLDQDHVMHYTAEVKLSSAPVGMNCYKPILMYCGISLPRADLQERVSGIGSAAPTTQQLNRALEPMGFVLGRCK